MNRRHFLRHSSLTAATILAGVRSAHGAGFTATKTTQASPNGYFTLGRAGADGRWLFLDPNGKPFFSLGLNHIDPASIRYPENIHLWRDKYGNSMERWLKESVRPNLEKWGFNTVGWVQEVITRQPTNHRHSRNFTAEEYQWLGMPYGHMLPFADFHQWEAETKHPDFFSPGFEQWCDHVAREHCVPLSNDKNLIGYWYIDCPTWVHDRPHNKWRGPLFDPAKLETESGRAELRKMATRYYQVTHDAIRRYDPHHLILGDRYEANARLPIEVVEAAKPFVDLLAFQDFKNPVEHLADWHQLTKMPVLWADGAHHHIVENKDDGHPVRRQNAEWFAEVLAGLRDNSGAVGAHLCGAYLRNRVRRCGLLGPDEKPDAEAIAVIRKANLETMEWVAGLR